MRIGRITISDRVTAGVYQDRSGPEIERILRQSLGGEIAFESCAVPDDRERISAILREFADRRRCDLILTTGGTGITSRDVTPEATRAVLEKELPGFGEIMRVNSFTNVKTAILSRAIAGVRGSSLIINLPGKPAAVRQCMELLMPAILEAAAHLRGEDPHLLPSSEST